MDIKEQFNLIEKTIAQDEITIEQQADAIEAINELTQAVLVIPIGTQEPEVPEVPDAPDPSEATLILQKDFRGTGLGKTTIGILDNEHGITTVEQLVDFGLDAINKLKGVSDTEADKIFARAQELIA